MENLEGTIFVYLSVGWPVCWLQRWADTNVTLALEDAQIIPSFSGNETDYTGNTDDTGDTDDTYDTDDKDDTYDTDGKDVTDDTDGRDDTDDTDDSFLLLFYYFSGSVPFFTTTT